MQDSSINLTQFPPEMLVSPGRGLEGKVHAALNASGKEQRSELKKVAQEFEAVFIAYLLKVMRETIEESGLMEEGFGKTIYTEMFDQEVSMSIARRGALGISDLLYKHLLEIEPEKEQMNSTESPASPHGSGNGASSQNEGRETNDLQLPVLAPVSSRFGPRADPFSHKRRMHKGVDFAAPKGAPVAAPLPGKVVSAGCESGYGNTILIQHPNGLQTRYGHLDAIHVQKGQEVAGGQIIGTVGDTGRSTGPHLHFEAIRMGKHVDPFQAGELRTADLKNGF